MENENFENTQTLLKNETTNEESNNTTNQILNEETNENDVNDVLLEQITDNKDLLNDLLHLLVNKDKLIELLNKFNLNIPENVFNEILNVLTYLGNETNNQPITIILDELQNVLEDGKLEIYEIPQLINVITENIPKLNIKKFNSKNLSTLIKVLIIILINAKVIKINSEDFQLISKVIDSSLVLLNTTAVISKFDCPWFNCFY